MCAYMQHPLPGYAFVCMLGALQTVRKRITVYEIPEHRTPGAAVSATHQGD